MYYFPFFSDGSFAFSSKTFPLEEQAIVCLLSNSKFDCTLIKKYCTKDFLMKLNEEDVKHLLVNSIQCSMLSDSDPIGLVAPNTSLYLSLEELFEVILIDYHNLKAVEKYPDSDWGDQEFFENLESSSIISINISCIRSLDGYPFISAMSSEQLDEVLAKVSF